MYPKIYEICLSMPIISSLQLLHLLMWTVYLDHLLPIVDLQVEGGDETRLLPLSRHHHLPRLISLLDATRSPEIQCRVVEALHKVQGDYHAHDLPPLPPLPERGDYSMNQFDDASERASGSSTDTVLVVAAARKNRKSPFAGTFAFQQHVSHVKTSNSPPLEDIVPQIQIQQEEEEEQEEQNDYQAYKDAQAEDDTMELTVPPPTRRGHRTHRQDEAGVSIATMSSIGEVIETGIAGDYTNYFEAEFARDNAKKVHDDRTQNSPFDFSSSVQGHSRQSSSISTNARGHRRGHARNTSIASLASNDGLEIPTLAGPPRSMHNRKRSSYISRHRSGISFDSNNGRSDWAASHRRMPSDESVMSNMSASRISRPGLGARMFELDGGVQLTSITASPADGHDQDEQDKEDEENYDEGHNTSKTTYYSTFEGQDSFHTALDTSFDSEVESSAKESDWSDKRASTDSASSSIFDPGPAKNKGIFLLRPLSAITTDSSSNEEDTFVNVNVSKCFGQVRRAPSCIEAQGEDTMSTSFYCYSSMMLIMSSCEYHSTSKTPIGSPKTCSACS
jgi:hypothetical protein